LRQSADVAIFALILLAGIEMQPAEIMRRSWRSIAVATGGVASLFEGATRTIDHYDPDVTIRGLLEVWRRNAPEAAA
jgi:pantothenate kinase type III